MSLTSSSRNGSLVGLGVLLALCSMGCATHPPVKAPIDTTRTFFTDFDHTWAAVVETAAQLVMPVESIAKDSGLLTLRRTAAPPEWMSCYDWPVNRAADYRQIARVNVFVKRISDRQTQVTINSFFERSNVPPEQAECYSTGQVENLFFAGIARNL
jgi:hypothetical protein